MFVWEKNPLLGTLLKLIHLHLNECDTTAKIRQHLRGGARERVSSTTFSGALRQNIIRKHEVALGQKQTNKNIGETPSLHLEIMTRVKTVFCILTCFLQKPWPMILDIKLNHYQFLEKLTGYGNFFTPCDMTHSRRIAIMFMRLNPKRNRLRENRLKLVITIKAIYLQWWDNNYKLQGNLGNIRKEG